LQIFVLLLDPSRKKVPRIRAHSNRARMALGYAKSSTASFPDVAGGVGIVDAADDFDRSRFPHPPSKVVYSLNVN
jgi:hypothetical protein